MPPPKPKGNTTASQSFDEPWSDSDWSESEKDKPSQAGSRPRQGTPKVHIVKDDISMLLDTFVKHGIAVKGEVSKSGDISFLFRSAPGKLIPVASDQPMLPAATASQQSSDGHGAGGVPKPAVKFNEPDGGGCKHHHHHRRTKRYSESGRRSSHKHAGGFFRGWAN